VILARAVQIERTLTSGDALRFAALITVMVIGFLSVLTVRGRRSRTR
jgi:hypothetical protein